MLSFMVNATASPLLVRGLGMADCTWARMEFLRPLGLLVRAETAQHYQELAQLPCYAKHSPELLWAWVTLLHLPHATEPLQPAVAELRLEGRTCLEAVREESETSTSQSLEGSDACPDTPRDKVPDHMADHMAGHVLDPPFAASLDSADQARWSVNERSHDPAAAAVAALSDLDLALAPLDVFEEDETTVAEGLPAVRRVFYAFVRMQYWADVKDGKLPRDSVMARLLLEAVKFGECNIHGAVTDLTRLLQVLASCVTCQCGLAGSLARFVRNMRDGSLFKRNCMPMRRGNAIFDLAGVICLIDAHTLAQRRIMDLCNLPGTSATLSLLMRAVVAESAREVEQAKQFLSMNRVSNELLRVVRTQQLAHALLHGAEARVREWVRSGRVRAHDAEFLLDEVRSNHRTVWASGLYQPTDEDSVDGSGGCDVEGWWHARDANLPLQLPPHVAASDCADRCAQGDDRLASYRFTPRTAEERNAANVNDEISDVGQLMPEDL